MKRMILSFEYKKLSILKHFSKQQNGVIIIRVERFSPASKYSYILHI